MGRMLLNLSFSLPVKDSEQCTLVANASAGKGSSGGTGNRVEFHIRATRGSTNLAHEDKGGQRQRSCRAVSPGSFPMS